jgi:hypothetical protein
VLLLHLELFAVLLDVALPATNLVTSSAIFDATLSLVDDLLDLLP